MTDRKYKLQVEQTPGNWVDVIDDSGNLLVFDSETEARSRLKELYPVETGLEEYAAGPKTTRVLIVDPFADKDEGWN